MGSEFEVMRLIRVFVLVFCVNFIKNKKWSLKGREDKW